MSPTPPLYTALPPRTIRLLTITPDTPPKCHLQTHSLDNAPPYIALSYVWGSTQDLHPLIVNATSTLHITPNLLSIITEYSRRRIELPIWIDALCIDQSNLSERTQQVRMMREIYTHAAKVLIWLGNTHGTDALALDTLRAINGPWAAVRWLPLDTPRDYPSYDALLSLILHESCYAALATFLARPWFTRMWVVQELVCAREVDMWCGEKTLDHDTVLQGAGRLEMLHNVNVKTQMCTSMQGPGRLKISCAGRLEVVRQVVKSEDAAGMMDLVVLTRGFDATDWRDRFFALVGLAGDVDEGFVDYALSYEEVVRRLSKMVLQGSIKLSRGAALDIWSCITREDGGEGDEKMQNPSWVVDFLK